MAVDHEKAREILERVEEAWDERRLTKSAFMSAWKELEEVLGEDVEGEGMEALILFAQPAWLEELGVTES